MAAKINLSDSIFVKESIEISNNFTNPNSIKLKEFALFLCCVNHHFMKLE